MSEFIVIIYIVFVVAVLALFCHRFYKAAARMRESDQRLNESLSRALIEAQKKMKEKEQQGNNEPPSSRS